MKDEAEPRPGMIRIRSDYVGAGDYLVAPDDRLVVVNTDYGVQCLDLDGHERWQADFGERCLGLTRRTDGMLIANTLHAVHQLRPDGTVEHVNPTLNEIAHAPQPWQDGVLVFTLSHAYALDAGGKVRWQFPFRETLGASVRATFVLNAFPARDGLMIGAVDYNSGLGRVLRLNEAGELVWASEVGPLTDVFPVGPEEFVYSVSGYGKFESHRMTIEGKSRWSLDYGGAGTALADGRLALLVGNNESPTWDNWELRLLDADGTELSSRKARGHFGYGPLPAADGHLYFCGYFKPFDPAATRLDYTSLVPLPKFLTFDHLMGVKAQPHQYRVYCFRAPLEGDTLELVFEDRNAIAFGPPIAGRDHVFFTHNRDLVALRL